MFRGYHHLKIDHGKHFSRGRVSINGLEDATEKVEAWRQEYNQVRPRSSIGNVAPAVFAEASLQASLKG